MRSVGKVTEFMYSSIIPLRDTVIVKKKLKGPKSTQGISTVNLQTSYKTILEYNRVIAKYHDDDRFIQAILILQRDALKYNRHIRIFYNPESGEVSNKADIKKSFNEYPWTCAYCKTPIISKINDISAKNFTCDKCFEIYIKNAKEINSRIVNSSYLFSMEVKNRFSEKNKKIIKYIKRNNEKQI